MYKELAIAERQVASSKRNGTSEYRLLRRAFGGPWKVLKESFETPRDLRASRTKKTPYERLGPE